MKQSENTNVIESTIFELDIASNCEEKNDTIMNDTKDEIYGEIHKRFINYMENENTLLILQKYLDALNSIKQTIEEQEKALEELLQQRRFSDFIDISCQIEYYLADINFNLYNLSLKYIENILNQNEVEKYKNIKIYELFQRLDNESIKSNDQLFLSWKSIFYLFLDINNQQKFLQIYFPNNETPLLSNENYYQEKGDFCVANFQGQFSKAIYCKRKKLKLTQVQLSKMSGVDRTMIAKIERLQQRTTLETTVKLLSALNMGITIFNLK